MSLDGTNHARVRSLFRRSIAWVTEPRLFWAIVLTVGVAVGGLEFAKPCDLAFRLVGMVAQLAGVAIAVWGVMSIRSFFGMTSFRAVTRDWWSRRPQWRVHHKMVTGSAHINLDGMSLRAHGTVSFDHSRSVPEQLRMLGDAIVGLHATIATMDERHSSANKDLAKELKTLSDRAALETAKVEEKLKSVQTSGLSLSLLAAALVVLGTVLTAVPVELAYYFGNPKPTCQFP